MAAQRSDTRGFLGKFLPKPVSADRKGNATAYKVGEAAFKRTKGATPALREVVRMHLQNSQKTQD